MKSEKFINGGIGFLGLGALSYFLYKKFGEDEDERDLNNTINDIQNTYGYTPKPMPDGGGKSRKRKPKGKAKAKAKSKTKTKK
jgi:hypothetical protein